MPRDSFRLVEREAELDVLITALGRAAEGQDELVVISGPPLSGKTALLEVFVDLAARSGWRTVALTGDPGRAAYGMNEEEPVLLIGRIDEADLSAEDVQTMLTRRRRPRGLLVVETTAISMATCLPCSSSWVGLGPLSVRGVEKMLSTDLGPDSAAWLAPVFHVNSGGSPGLVRGLLDDHRAALAQGADPLLAGEDVVGAAYRQKVLAALDRLGPRALTVARGMAVLGKPTSDGVLANLVGHSVQDVTKNARALDRCGVLDGRAFRHPAGRQGVLDALPHQARRRWHAEAASVLQQYGAAPDDVAEHLTEADEVDRSWGVQALRLGARTDFDAGRIDRGTRRLELAARWCRDEHARADMLLTLLRTQWHRDPANAIRYLGPLRAAMAEGRLLEEHVRRLAAFLVWYGHADEVADPLVPSNSRAASTTHDGSGGPTATGPGALMKLVRAGADPDRIIVTAEATLARRVSGGWAVEALVPLLSLVWAGRSDRAAHWCDAFLAKGGMEPTHAGTALLETIRAKTALRLGDLRGAAERARRAEQALSPRAWGLIGAMPLSVRVAAATASGDHTQATALLRRPVPGDVLKTSFGLHHDYARGRHHLAIERSELALEDFRRCGETARAAALDLPVIVPWRLGLAEALLALDRREEAIALIGEHLALPGAEWPASQGSALRLLAAANPAERVHTLNRAVQLLDSAGNDQLELVRAYRDLGQALDEVGERERARGLVARAAAIVAMRASESLRSQTSTVSAGTAATRALADDVPTPSLEEASGIAVLTDAERRVAALAAHGHGNPAISRMLFITVSTVEQHMTRVYRKLNVKKRSHLPATLKAEPVALDL